MRPRPKEARATAQPITFLQAAAFQWVNPKAWAMALGAVAAYVPEPSLWAYAAVAVVFGAVNLPSVASGPGLGKRCGAGSGRAGAASGVQLDDGGASGAVAGAGVWH